MIPSSPVPLNTDAVDLPGTAPPLLSRPLILFCVLGACAVFSLFHGVEPPSLNGSSTSSLRPLGPALTPGALELAPTRVAAPSQRAAAAPSAKPTATAPRQPASASAPASPTPVPSASQPAREPRSSPGEARARISPSAHATRSSAPSAPVESAEPQPAQLAAQRAWRLQRPCQPQFAWGTS